MLNGFFRLFLVVSMLDVQSYVTVALYYKNNPRSNEKKRNEMVTLVTQLQRFGIHKFYGHLKTSINLFFDGEHKKYKLTTKSVIYCNGPLGRLAVKQGDFIAMPSKTSQVLSISECYQGTYSFQLINILLSGYCFRKKRLSSVFPVTTVCSSCICILRYK